MIANQQCRPFDSRYLPFASSANQIRTYKAYGNCGSIINQTARKLCKEPSAVSQIVRSIQKKGDLHFSAMEYDEEADQIVMRPLRVWIYDIETAPSEAYVWQFYNQNIGHNMIKAYGHVISYAGKWLGDEEIDYQAVTQKEMNKKDDKRIIQQIIDKFSEADVVIGHNGKAFDCKTVTGRALIHGIKPPTPFKIVDTLLAAKRYFKLPRNSLECIASELGCIGKLKHKNFPGFDLWRECIAGNPDAWEEMKTYNIQDVGTLEEVYLRMRPWISDHPNMGILLESNIPICPKCASPELRKPRRKHFITTNTQKYHLYTCTNCGGYARSRTTVLEKEKRKKLVVHAV